MGCDLGRRRWDKEGKLLAGQSCALSRKLSCCPSGRPALIRAQSALQSACDGRNFDAISYNFRRLWVRLAAVAVFRLVSD